MPFCAVKWCGKCSATSSVKKDGITFHRFPKCSRTKEKWIDATKRDSNWFPTKNSVICSRHFTQDSFSYKVNKRFLCKNAVPTLMLPSLGPSRDESLAIDTGSESRSLTNDLSALPNDMENYMEYHLLGSVSQVRMKPDCIPTKFQCHPASGKQISNTKKRKKTLIDEHVNDLDKKSITAKYLEFEVPPPGSSVLRRYLENTKQEDQNMTLDKSNKPVGVSWLATSNGAEASTSTQRMFSNVDGNNTTNRLCDDRVAAEASSSQQHSHNIKDTLKLRLNIKEEVRDPDDEQRMDQDNNPAVEKYTSVEPDIKKEPAEDACQFENSVTVLSHVAKSTADSEELVRQLEAKTSMVEMYKNDLNELQQKNVVLQDRCEKLTKLLKKCLTKSPCKEIGTEFKNILSNPQGNLENYRNQVQLRESKFKANIKLLLENVEESQEVLKTKQKQWETKENEYLEKIKQLEQNLQELQQGHVDNQAVQFLRNDNTLEDREKEWLEKEKEWSEKEREWLEKERQWQAKERLWQEQVNEKDRQISQLQGTRLEPLGTNR